MLSAGNNDEYDMVDNWELVRESERGLLIRLEDGEEHWLPKSQVTYDLERRWLTLPMWLARKIGVTDE